MTRIRITGWTRGLDKVAMTKAIRQHSELDLAQAKSCTDSVLDGEAVIVNTPTPHNARLLLEQLLSLGATAELAD